MNREERILEDAKTAVKAGDLARARELLTEYFKTQPKNPDAWLWMSAAVTTDADRLACLKRALAIDPKNQAAIAGLRMMGEKVGKPLRLIRTEPVIEKVSAFQKFLDEKLPVFLATAKEKPVLYGVSAFALLVLFIVGVFSLFAPKNQNDPNDIMRWATPLPTNTPTPVPTPTYIGPQPLWMKLEATFTPTAMFVATPHSRMEAYSAGMKAYEQQNWPRAVEYLNQALASEPNSPDILYHLGDAYRFLDRYPDAETAYNKAIDVDASFAPAYLGLGRVYIYGPSPDLNQAQVMLEQAIVLNNTLFEAYLELAHVAILNKDPDLALNWISRLNGLLPETAQADYYLAYAYYLKGDPAQALPAIQKANQLDLTLLPVYLLWGQILQQNGDFKASLDPTSTYLTYAPTDTSGILTLASGYFHIGEYDPAMTALTTVIDTRPDIIEAYLMRAQIYMARQDYPNAQADYEAVLKIDPNSFDASLGRGLALFENNNPGSAYMQFTHMDKTPTNDSQRAQLVYWQAMCLYTLGETDKAISAFEAYLAYPVEIQDLKARENAEAIYQVLTAPTPTPTLSASPSPTP